MSSRSQQTMWPGEVSIGALEGCLAGSRPYRRSALPFARIDEKRTEACALCGRRQAPLESALMDRTDSSARRAARHRRRWSAATEIARSTACSRRSPCRVPWTAWSDLPMRAQVSRSDVPGARFPRWSAGRRGRPRWVCRPRRACSRCRCTWRPSRRWRRSARDRRDRHR